MSVQMTFLDDVYPNWSPQKKHGNVLFESETCEWETPKTLFDALNAEFHFTLDPCATDKNAKCDRYFTKDDDGLEQDWGSEAVYCNPPYGLNIGSWVKKCYEHGLKGHTAVMLVPARTDTRWFHRYVYGKAEIRFIKGRIKYSNAKNNAPFPSMIVIYRGNVCESV